jgi:hypothetical protein
MKIENVVSRVVMLGGNRFESGIINIAAGAKVTAGTVLKRVAGNTFSPVVSTETTPGTHGVPAAGGGWATEPTDPIPGDVPAAVMPFDIINDKGADGNFGFRAMVEGRVRADMLRIAGNATTPEQNDMLRNVGILPTKVTDLSHTDNQ